MQAEEVENGTGKTRHRIIAVLLAACTFAAAASNRPASAYDLGESFRSPPPEYRPMAWYFWNGGHVSRDGLTKDLDDMRATGIGGGMVMHVASLTRGGPVEFLSGEWRALMAHMFREAARNSLRFGVHNCPGYSSSGGPWVPVEQSMKSLGWTETPVTGPGRRKVRLPRPPARLDFYRDVAVLAYPERKGGGDLLRRHREAVSVKSGGRALELDKLTDRNPATDLVVATSVAVTVAFAEPVTVCAALWGGRGAGKDAAGTLSYVDETGAATKIARFAFARRSAMNKTANFTPVTARSFRFEFDESYRQSRETRLAELGLFTSPLIADPAWKAHFASQLHATDPDWQQLHELAGKADPPGSAPEGLPAVPSAGDVLDLTEFLGPDGTLDWDAPPGDWTVIRFGMTTNGKGPHPAPPTGSASLECDKLDGRAMRAHLESYIGRLAEDAGPLAGGSFRFSEIDSYEVGFQNWTARMPEKFRALRGYEIGPWMVTLAARPLNSLQESDRFLWDFRRTVLDLFADEYYGVFNSFLDERGMLSYAEAYGPQVFESSRCGGRVDVPMAEVWWGEPDENATRTMGRVQGYCRGAHAANTYGRRIVACEAFSTGPPDAGWRNHPRAMKMRADGMFLSGINQLIFHAYCHQAYDAAPGQTMSVWGSQFGRHVTWWPISRGWHDYLARCQFLLRQGGSRSDIARHLGEQAPERPWMPGVTPAGYRTDQINTEVIVRDMSVRDGKLVLPHGAEYSLLYLEQVMMRPELARKIESLVRKGATVVGPRPARTPGLHNWREADAEVKAIGDRVWGDCDGKRVTEHRYGKGRVFWGRPVAEVLASLGARPDFECEPGPLGWIHRVADGLDIYLVVNGSKPISTEGVFRVTGRMPELWDPMTGQITRPRAFSVADDGRTRVTLDLPADGTVFVVFREDGPADLPAALDPATIEAAAKIAGPWDVSFQPGRGAPAHARFDCLLSWPEHDDAGIRYFSGIATYCKTFEVQPGTIEAGGRLLLDLGKLADVARVRLNGREAGYVWARPARVEITKLVRPGENRLEIEVANRWINRLIGDEQFPDDVQWERAPHFGSTGYALAKVPDWFPDLSGRGEPRRIAFPFFKHYTRDDPLVPSGLLGPVTLCRASGAETN